LVVERSSRAFLPGQIPYQRYETDAHLQTLNQLYRLLRLYTNFFQRSVKLTNKSRQGSKVTKRYDEPQTPCRRLLSSPHLSPIRRRNRLQPPI